MREAVELVVVTKMMAADVINEAISEGVRAIGESKVQEFSAKIAQLNSVAPLEKHLIGSLQTNKVSKALELFDVIQSVDRPKLAQALNRTAAERGRQVRCLVEVKISPEDTKAGIPLAEAADFIKEFQQYSNLDCIGLMTIAPYDLPDDDTRGYFQAFKRFFDTQKLHLGAAPILSMGMTDDFEIAIEEGSTMVRIGRAIFGDRNTK